MIVPSSSPKATHRKDKLVSKVSLIPSAGYWEFEEWRYEAKDICDDMFFRWIRSFGGHDRVCLGC